MTRITWLADVLRAEGLSVREHGGWQTRGSAQFSAQGLVLHHTAGRTGSVHPSLGICINGRPGLPGPLCHVLVDRDGTCHVIAAGRANHAGAGRWRHLSGNSQVVGIEIEHSGSLTEPWTARVLDASMSAAAAICRRASIPPELVCLHKEWAPARKIDPIGWHGPTTRDRIARLITPPEPIQEDDDMRGAIEVIEQENSDDVWLHLVASDTVRRVKPGDRDHFRNLARSAANPQYAGPYRWPLARIKRHPIDEHSV